MLSYPPLVDYIAMISLCFFFLPFTFFYSEVTLEAEDADLGLNYGSGEDDDYDVTTTNSYA